MAKVTVLSSFPFPQGKVLLSLTIIASSLFAVSETNLCTNCTVSQVCCFDVCVEGPNCVGQFCHYDEHCSEGEICCSSKCVERSSPVGCPCQNDGQCSTSQHCCNFTCLNASNCLGKNVRIRRNALTDRYVVPILAFGDQVVWDSVVTLAIRNAETASFAATTSV